MIEIGTGNLLRADAEALVNTVNTVGVMGKGIALQFKRAFPDNFKVYKRACDAGEVRLGRMFVTETPLDRPRFIINFPTKKHWRSRSSIEDIEAGLADLKRVVLERGIRSIAVPPLGCGQGGLAWADVEPLIREALEDVPNVRVLLFAPTGTPEPSTMPVGTPRPRMTPGRAALVGLLQRFESAASEASQIAIQKLMYFMQVAGEPLSLRFVQGRYGPYADNLNHVLQAIEGHFVTGYGDRSGPVDDAAPIRLLPGASDEATDVLADMPDTRHRLEDVRELIDGFESTYTMELLGTVHWVATQEDPEAAKDVDRAVELVQAWNPRKGHLFTPKHIEMAWDRLNELGWFDRGLPADS